MLFVTDYTAVNNRVLTFEPGSTEESFDVDINDDTVDEEDTEDLFLTITTNQDGVILTPDTTRVVIADDDRKNITRRTMETSVCVGVVYLGFPVPSWFIGFRPILLTNQGCTTLVLETNCESFVLS